jgi:plastocyanin
MIAVLALILVADPSIAAAPRGNGFVTGLVRVEQPPRPQPPVKVAKDASVCGKEAARELVMVGPKREVANVVVSLKGVKLAKAPAPTPKASVDQVGCRYIPHVQAVTVGTTLNLLNNDAVLHNVHGTSESKGAALTVFNVAMPFKGQKLPTVLRRPGPIKLRCDAGHTWMSAYVHVFDHPFFAVTDYQGRFTIKDVPAGKYILELWHEPIEDKGKPSVRSIPVIVEPGKQTSTDATITL